MDAPASPFIDSEGVLTLAVTGELDLSSRDLLREAITTAIRTDDVTRVVVDLEAVTFPPQREDPKEQTAQAAVVQCLRVDQEAFGDRGHRLVVGRERIEYAQHR